MDRQPGGLVHRTAPARAGEPPHPLLVLLHGRGSDELDLLGLAPELDPRCFIVSARAPFRWQIGYCWFEMEGTPEHAAATLQESLNQLWRFTDDLVEAYPVDRRRIYLLGFSQGAFMANALTLCVPDRIAGAALLSGFQPDPSGLPVQAEGLRGKPFFVAHGTLDPLLDIQLGRAVRETLSRLGADVTYREYPMGHQVIAPELADLQAWLSAQLDRAPA